MRENCTYGLTRGRAHPTRGVPLYSTSCGICYIARHESLRNFKPDRCYHLISRIENRAFYLTDEERTRFVERLWREAKFSGIEVLAYC